MNPTLRQRVSFSLLASIEVAIATENPRGRFSGCTKHLHNTATSDPSGGLDWTGNCQRAISGLSRMIFDAGTRRSAMHNSEKTDGHTDVPLRQLWRDETCMAILARDCFGIRKRTCYVLLKSLRSLSLSLCRGNPFSSEETDSRRRPLYRFTSVSLTAPSARLSSRF